MVNKPLFSVLLANYNNGKYIKEAIESILRQTYQQFEIIIVDDASTDNSLEVIAGFEKDKRIRLFTNDTNKGCGYSKWRAAKLSAGDILAFLDPDDAIAPNALERMVVSFQDHPECSIINSTHVVCKEDLTPERNAYGACSIPTGDSYLSYGKGITAFASFQSKFYAQTNGVNPDFKRAVDQDLYYKLEEVGKTFFIDEPLYLYRIQPGGISTFKNLSKARYWHVRAMEDAYQRRTKNHFAKNISQKDLAAWRSVYLASKASDAFQGMEIRSGVGFLFKSFRTSFFDRHWIIKIKSLFLNSSIHRFYKVVIRK